MTRQPHVIDDDKIEADGGDIDASRLNFDETANRGGAGVETASVAMSAITMDADEDDGIVVPASVPGSSERKFPVEADPTHPTELFGASSGGAERGGRGDNGIATDATGAGVDASSENAERAGRDNTSADATGEVDASSRASPSDATSASSSGQRNPNNAAERLPAPGAYRVMPHGNRRAPSPAPPTAAAVGPPMNTAHDVDALVQMLGIPMVEAEAVDPVNPLEGDEEAGAFAEFDAAVSVSRNWQPPATTTTTSSSPREGGGGEGGAVDVILAKSIPTITIGGKTVQRSTVFYFVGVLLAMAVVVAITVPLAIENERKALTEAQIRAARARRRTALVDILSGSLGRYGTFNGTVHHRYGETSNGTTVDDELDDNNASSSSANHRKEALEWLVDDFPQEASTAAELLARYPEWKMRQRYVVALLYFSTGGADWNGQLGFLSAADECDWAGLVPRLQGDRNKLFEDGVRVYVESDPSFDLHNGVWNKGGLTCDKDGRLDTISLGVNNLVGTVPDELGSLGESMLKIGLMRNTISSTIPSHLSELENLRTLNLMENCLTGVIPESLSKLTKLNNFKVRGNNDLRGNLNAFCNGTEYRDDYPKKLIIQAECGDCPGSAALVECTCCRCCELNSMRCCEKDGTPEKNNKVFTWETFNRGECSLNDIQRAWKEENCPCFTKEKGTSINVECSTDCPVESNLL